MPIAGPVAPAPGVAARKRQGQMSYRHWKREIPKRDKDVTARVSKSQGAEFSTECWEETLADVSAGRLADPVDITGTMQTTVPLAPMYAIRAQHGNQIPKIRPIDDFRASDINAIFETGDTNIPDSLGAFISIDSYYKILSPRRHPMCATMDFDHRGGFRNQKLPIFGRCHNSHTRTSTYQYRKIRKDSTPCCYFSPRRATENRHA